MSYSAQQIAEKGKQPRYIKKAKNKLNKKFHHRHMRRKMKKLDFVPHYNRFDGGWQE